MVENNRPRTFCGKTNDLCCITVNKIFDSAKDKDCLEDIRVHLCDCSQETVDRATAIRCRDVDVIDTQISLEPIPFNKGFYQVLIRYYFCVTLECCLCMGRTETVKGIAVFDKKIILFGSEKNVNVFTSDPENNSFCPADINLTCRTEPTLPTVSAEVAKPVCLDTKVVEKCRPFGNCCIPAELIPDRIKSFFDGNFTDGIGTNRVYVSIGMFSVIRMERPVQLILPTCNFCLPEKESTPTGCADPCSVFGKMNFPYDEFYPYANTPEERSSGCNCGK